MSVDLLFLAVCFLAALVQTTTGLGFGLIVAPILLAVYPPVDAIQITGFLTLVIILSITPFIKEKILKGELGSLAIGSVIGLVAGSVFLKVVPINGIRIAALVVLIYAFTKYLKSHFKTELIDDDEMKSFQKPGTGIFYGLASGMMGAALAMPGPMALIFLRERRIDPAKVRATVFALMIGSYVGMLIISVSLSGVSEQVLGGLIHYLPPTIVGLLSGIFLSDRIPGVLFDVITTLLMFSTLVVLFVKIIGDYS